MAAVREQRSVVSISECFSPLVDRDASQVHQFSESTDFKDSWTVTRCSKSSPVSPDNWLALSHNRKKLKEHCRCGVTPTVRKKIWLEAIGVTDDDSVLFAKAFGEPQEDMKMKDDQMLLFGLPFSLECIGSFHLRQRSFEPAFKRVLSAVYCWCTQRYGHSNPSPLVVILTRIMLHFLDEWEVFAVLSFLMKKKAWLNQGDTEMTASQMTLHSLLQSHAHSTLHNLESLKPRGMALKTFLNKLTLHWYTWPFYNQPFWIAVRVVDLYLVEGPKVIYRLALSGLKLYTSLCQSTEGSNLETSVHEILSSLTVEQKTRWFHDAYAISHLPWSAVLKVWSSSLTAAATQSAQALLKKDTQPPTPGSNGRQVTPDLSSEVIRDKELWDMIWRWLPDWVLTESPQCVFRASRDGYNLRTFYRKCEHLSCLLLVVRTKQGAVFGSFIASPLEERHGVQFFGTGETFLFSLSPLTQCYKWSGKSDLILRATDEELIVGSGGGAFGFSIDGDLDSGSTSTCTAFNNPPLTGNHSLFNCAAFEVYDCTE